MKKSEIRDYIKTKGMKVSMKEIDTALERIIKKTLDAAVEYAKNEKAKVLRGEHVLGVFEE